MASQWTDYDMMPEHFCVVDDDDDFLHFLSDYIAAHKLKASVFTSGEYLLKSGDIGNFDFFVLDLGLPGIDGVDLIAMIRARTMAGILVVSGRMGPDAFNSALNAGADMFINKPVRFDQVFSAIKTVYRRSREVTAHGDTWTLEQGTSALIAPDGTSVSLSESEFALLARLFAAAGEPVSREDLAASSGILPGADCRNLDAAIFRLRRKIERETDGPSPLRTERGKGYCLAAPCRTR